MINRVFAKELIGFSEVDLEFSNGLNVITGPSGAGKSVLIGSILANFGLSNQEAKLCEVEIDKPKNLHCVAYELEDEVVIKSLKKDRVRYFIDGQNISKKALKELFKNYIFYISVRDKSGFESERLIDLIDTFIKNKEPKYGTFLNEYATLFSEYESKKEKLSDIEQKIKEQNERVEFLKYEIEKIESINPKEGEYDELLLVKKRLSKLDKINEIANRVEAIFEYEDSVYELFEMLEKDSSFFSEAMNQLRSDLDDINSLSEDLSEINIEEVLDRLEQISSLIKRFGSVQEALEYLNRAKEELQSFEHINEDVSRLKEEIKKLENALLKKAEEISNKRKSAAKEIEKELEAILKELKLPKANFVFGQRELYSLGVDELSLELENTKIENLSGGEFNRVRLALLTVAASGSRGEGAIILDEIDANVSGDESIAIANMISKLSKSYQIFAISHQPHLSSKANMHILISKDSSGSFAKVLENEDRVKEIARIVGGENYNKEALEFAKGLF